MKNPFLIVFILFTISIFGCKTPKEKQTIPENKVNQSTENKLPGSKDNNPVSTKENSLNSSGIEQSSNVEKLKNMDFVSAKGNDTIFATMEKTPCYGTCPVYKLMIFKSGLAIYQGIRNVDKTGRFLVYFSLEEMKEIENKANEINYFKLKDEYDSPVTDFPTTITSLRINGKVKVVSNRVGGPPELKGFEKHIDETLMRKEFKELDK
ncbi:MAG: hypothetical protein H0V01_11620 [Bacteroidetes bacterium]|nr:hypothetical protein [Bacteroidota bacterium]HET6245257.1 DUF6438 domain-containing protein [Bacteroidia bacterium]